MNLNRNHKETAMPIGPNLSDAGLTDEVKDNIVRGTVGMDAYFEKDPNKLKGVQLVPLFKESRHHWYPNLIYDTKTKNESFVLEAKRLKASGVKNYSWPLVLLQPELQGVDPHDPNLDTETCVKIAVECKLNPIYYFREVVRLKASTQSGWGPFKASRLNLAQIFLYFCGVGALYVAPRQQGKTTGIYILDWYLMVFWLRNAKINLLTIAIKNGLEAINMMKQVRDMTPYYLYNPAYADGNGREKIRIDKRNNEWSFIVHASSALDADMKGRGLTSPNPRADEFAYIKHLKKTMMSALPGSTTAMEQAELDGLPNGLIWATTAGELDTESGAYAYNIVSRAYIFTEMLYDLCSREDVKSVVKAGSKQNMVYAEFSYLQLGKDKGWLESLRRDNGYDRITLEKDFLNIWVRGSSASLIPVVHRAHLSRSEVEAPYTQIGRDLLTLRWYKDEKYINTDLVKDPTIITVDTSDGVGGDGNGLYLMNTNTTETLMAASINEVNLLTLAYQIADMLIKYPRMLLNIEAKSTARAFIDIIVLKLLAVGEDPFKRIYNDVVSNPESHPKLYAQYCLPMNKRNRDVYTQSKKYFGFMTTGDSRSTLYGTVLSTALKSSSRLAKDKQLISELLGITIKNGRIDHTSSGNDDLVIAWLMNHWTLVFGKNLHEYGIKANEVMQLVSDKGGVATEEERLMRAKVDLLRKEIEEVKELLQGTENPFLYRKFEVRLKVLINTFSQYSDEPLSFTEIVSDIQERKQLGKKGKKSIILQ